MQSAFANIYDNNFILIWKVIKKFCHSEQRAGKFNRFRTKTNYYGLALIRLLILHKHSRTPSQVVVSLFSPCNRLYINHRINDSWIDISSLIRNWFTFTCWNFSIFESGKSHKDQCPTHVNNLPRCVYNRIIRRISPNKITLHASNIIIAPRIN